MKMNGVYIQKSLLLIPLIWYALIWVGMVFGVSVRSFGIEPEDAGLLSFLWLFLGTPITFIVGISYTFVKKYWLWLGAYIVLGGGPILTYLILVFF